MAGVRTVWMVLGGIAIAVLAFVITTYVLNWASPPISRSSTPSVSGTASTGIGSDNLISPSQDFESPKWSRVHVSVQSEAGAAPGGANAASRLVESADNSVLRHYVAIASSAAKPGAIATFSIYFKPSERSSIMLEIRDDPPGKYGTVVCTPPEGASNGSAEKNGDIVDAGIETADNGWYRCWGAMPFDLARVALAVYLREQNGVDYQGDGHSGLLIWGAQFQAGSRPSTYVETTTSAG